MSQGSNVGRRIPLAGLLVLISLGLTLNPHPGRAGQDTPQTVVPVGATNPATQPSDPAASGAATRLGGHDLPPDLIALVLRRGDAMERRGDISAARLLYARAARAGSAEGATAMGKTFDPAALAELGLRDVTADPDLAASWYLKAMALGDRQAASRLQKLGSGSLVVVTGSRPPKSGLPPLRSSRAQAPAIERDPARATGAECRAIVIKVEVGEEPTDAERSYLRRGCTHG